MYAHFFLALLTSQRESVVPFFSLLVKDIYFINESAEKMWAHRFHLVC
jgi:hypothetical protein